MVHRFVLVLPVLALLGAGCQSHEGSGNGQESAAARALCDREAQTNNPPGVRGTLVGSFETTNKAVEPEIRREYKNSSRAPRLASEPQDEPLALCYYDVPAAQVQIQHGIERVGVIVDQKLNSFLLYAGPKAKVPIRGIG